MASRAFFDSDYSSYYSRNYWFDAAGGRLGSAPLPWRIHLFWIPVEKKIFSTWSNAKINGR